MAHLTLLKHKLKTNRRKLFTGVGVLIFLIILLVLLTGEYRIKIPARVTTRLHNNGISLDTDYINVRLLPVPHIYTKHLFFSIRDDVTLEVHDVQIRPDLLSLLFDDTPRVESVTIRKSMLHVLEPEPLPVPEQTKRTADQPYRMNFINKVLDEVIEIIELVPDQYRWTKYLNLQSFELYIDSISKEAPFITADNFRIDSEDNRLVSNTAFNLAGRVRGTLQVVTHLNEETLKADYVEARISADSLNVPDDSGTTITRDRNSGRADGEQKETTAEEITKQAEIDFFAHFKLPVERIITSGSVNILNLETGPLLIRPEDDIHVSFYGEAGPEAATAPFVKFRFRDDITMGSFRYSYKDYLLSLTFTEEERFNIATVLDLIKGARRLRRALHPVRGSLYLKSAEYNPWEGRLRAEGSLSAASGDFRLISGIYADLKRINLPGARIKGRNSDIKLKKAHIQTRRERFYADADGYIALSDISDNMNGRLQISTIFDCNLSPIDCRKRHLNIYGRRLTVRATEAARFYRLLSIDFFEYWKSLKKDSEVIIDSAEYSGYTAGRYFNITEGMVDSDVGNLNIEGRYSPVEKDGLFKIRLVPLQFDKIIQPIPVIGSALNNTLRMAAEVIFTVIIDQNEGRIETVTISRALETVRELF